MEFPVHKEYPPVQELTIHLLNQQVVYFKPNMTEEEIQSKMDHSHSTLMAFLITMQSILMDVIYSIKSK